ncbi:MAG: PIN domain protein [Magnetococcales bacterium]|nr:PIN domain protein [Magnetococcales bacterium]
MKPRIYTDTSVIGGYLDKEFKEWSVPLVESFQSGSRIIVLSNITILELDRAPSKVKSVLEKIPESHRESVILTDEAKSLAKNYIQAGVISAKKSADAQHIALATIHRVDVLVSWNFKDIVNLNQIRGYNAINLRLGYPLLEIRTPREVIGDERGKKL